MEETDSDGVVYVALNYRLGALGWLAGDKFTGAGGSANLGLQDQRLALDWIQHNIHRFGGDPSRVTVMGESGGATSIGYQISTTAEGVSDVPFQQAIFQSTAEVPLLPNSALDANFQSFLDQLGVDSLEEAKNADTDLVQAANNATVYLSPTGRFPYGPSSDGSWVKGIVGQDLTAGHFNRSLNVITAYNRNEGTQFIQHNITNFAQYAAEALPGAAPDEINHITSTLYPPPGPNTSYTSTWERAYLFTSELFVDCYADSINRAVTGEAYTYRFNVAPAHHTTDLPYTFYNGPSPRVANEAVALAMQTFFTNFAVHGDPNVGSTRESTALPRYGDGRMLDLTDEGFDVVEAPIANARCAYWADPGSAV